MKKCLVGLLMMGSLLSLTFLTGCNNKEVITTDKSTSSQQSVTSDVNVEEQQGNNIKLEFSDDNFAVNMTLPNEWSTKLREDLSTEWVKFPLMNLESQYNIYDENNNCIGAIGYSEYTPQKDVEELPQAIYSGVAVPNNYNFNARTVDEGGFYIPVKDTDSGTTAITKVYYAPNISKDVGYGGEEVYNKGILSYNKNLLVYIAMEFDDNAISEEELKEVASSIIIEKNIVN